MIFASDSMAQGYAQKRPPLHNRIVDLAMAKLNRGARFERALDLGCGAGLSTAALRIHAHQVIGVDPAVAMMRWTAGVSPGASFAAARAEELPLRAGAIDLISAAGSLNYVDLPVFLREARRVLAPGGLILMYDFATGRTFPDSPALDEWFESFISRYPWPPTEGVALSPDSPARVDPTWTLRHGAYFEMALSLTLDFYIEYVLTETNVAYARQRGVDEAEIRTWCRATLSSFWGGFSREVLFRGYYAWLVRTASL